LDAGHHLGAIEAAAYCYQKNVQALFNFNKSALNEDLGLENKEFITACIITGEIKVKEKSVRRLRSKVPFVNATDYFEASPFIESGYQDTIINQINSNIWQYSPSYYDLDLEKFKQAILSRRSARFFKKEFIKWSELLDIIKVLSLNLPLIESESIDIYIVVNRVEGLEAGVYKNQTLIKQGDFSERVGYLCINQAVVRDSAVTFFFTCDCNNYQNALQGAGWLGQKIYLVARYLNLGCSGIGAFYDDETQEFLQTRQDILYAMVIGR
jgi:nitroreductase